MAVDSDILAKSLSGIASLAVEGDARVPFILGRFVPVGLLCTVSPKSELFYIRPDHRDERGDPLIHTPAACSDIGWLDALALYLRTFHPLHAHGTSITSMRARCPLLTTDSQLQRGK